MNPAGTIRVRFPGGELKDWPTVKGIAGRLLPRPGDGWEFRKEGGIWIALGTIERASA